MYTIIHAIVWLLSRLPLRILYILSDGLYCLVYHVAKYRRDVVRSNLQTSFPDRSKTEIKQIEKRFYSFFCDYIVETIKLLTISPQEITHRVKFEGVEEMVNTLKGKQKNFAFIYLSHYGNWEWIASLALHIHQIDPKITAGQIYHPLRNKQFDQLFLNIRSRFEGENIPMKDSLRYIINKRRNKQPTIIGFIADQAPKWNSIHHWTPFLNHNTPVFTGTEQLAKQVDAIIFYAKVERSKRGYYKCHIHPMTDIPNAYPNFQLTDQYFQLLEETIQVQPAFWLWSHKRWKRTYEEYLERQKNIKTSSKRTT